MKALLLLHLALAVLLLGSSGHLTISAWQVSRGRREKLRLFATYSRIVIWLYPITVLLGAVIYPAFRVEVRATYFDVALPWATALFEIKEHLVGLALPLTTIPYWIARRPNATGLDRLRLASSATVFGVVLGSAIIGALLVSYRSI